MSVLCFCLVFTVFLPEETIASVNFRRTNRQSHPANNQFRRRCNQTERSHNICSSSRNRPNGRRSNPRKKPSSKRLHLPKRRIRMLRLLNRSPSSPRKKRRRKNHRPQAFTRIKTTLRKIHHKNQNRSRTTTKLNQHKTNQTPQRRCNSKLL